MYTRLNKLRFFNPNAKLRVVLCFAVHFCHTVSLYAVIKQFCCQQ